MFDVAQSKGGRLDDTRSGTLAEGPLIYFSHSSMLLPDEPNHARISIGLLRRMFETLYAETSSGRLLRTYTFGKPTLSIFEYATRLLRRWHALRHNLAEDPDTPLRKRSTSWATRPRPTSAALTP